MPDLAIIEFQSASTAGVVNVEIGFVPSHVELIADYAGAAKVYDWLPNARFSNFLATSTVVQPGGSVANSLDATTMIQPYLGGDSITSAETANTAGKHVDRSGNPSAAGRITAPGITLSATTQVNSGRNIVKAFRNDR